MRSDLTIIIPFLNEGIEIENTISSIFKTAITNPSIILINDSSTDGFNYEELKEKYNSYITYINHQERKGVAASRDEGVMLVETPHFLLLDGHMRFYEKGWDERLIKLLEKYPRSVLCSQTKVLWREDSGNIITKDHVVNYGAYIKMDNLKAEWNKYDNPECNIMEIPCILGAAYACEKSYWIYLHGLTGLINYGMDEQLISTKIWLEGGKCLLIKDWIVGHLYRKRTPYGNPVDYFTYNRLYVAELLFPFAIKQKVFQRIRSESKVRFAAAYSQLKENYSEIKKEKEYLYPIFNYPIEEFLIRNKDVFKKNMKNYKVGEENTIHIIMQ